MCEQHITLLAHEKRVVKRQRMHSITYAYLFDCGERPIPVHIICDDNTPLVDNEFDTAVLQEAAGYAYVMRWHGHEGIGE